MDGRAPLVDPLAFDGSRIACSRIMRQIAFSPGGLAIVAAIVFFNLAAFAAGLVVIYIGDEYVTPAFSEQSVPPPLVH